MEPGQSLARSTRLAQIQHLLHQKAGGLTTAELARLCGVCARTIQRDLLALHDLGIPVAQEQDRYSLLSGYLLPPVSFSRVGSTLEMTPWIRGWGPDVEVLVSCQVNG